MMDLQVYASSVRGAGRPSRCPDMQSYVLLLGLGNAAHSWSDIYKMMVEAKKNQPKKTPHKTQNQTKHQREKEVIWSDSQMPSWSYLKMWNEDNGVTFKNGEERGEKHFLKSRISAESFL